MIKCSECGLKFSDPALASTASQCPNCGSKLEYTVKRGDNLIAIYFRDVWTILSKPAEFFQKTARDGGLGGPLAFALVTHWIGAALSYMWRAVLGGLLGDDINRLVKIAGSFLDLEKTEQFVEVMSIQKKISHWMWGVGTVVIDPFLTLFGIFFAAIFIYLGARILVTPGKNGAPREISYQSAVRIICYATTPSLFYAIPFMGSIAASLATLILTIIGAKEIYRVGAGRAIMIALFSKIVLGVALLGIFSIAVFEMFRLFS